MSETNVEQPQTANPISNKALKIVLFGMPDAGKTSLLGALAQAGQGKESALGGTLLDVTGELTELRRQVYEAKTERTPEEVAPYPVEFQPDESFIPVEPKPSNGPLSVVLFDCDGRRANEFLSERKTSLATHDSELASAILQADALLLVVDASSRVEVLKRDFAQFIQFLHLFEISRSHRSEVNGLPVYLVLTKCDLLAKSDDTPSVWMDRIEERKRKVDQHFHKQLAEVSGEEARPFGKIDLHVWATAIKRPALGSTSAKPREPYQVAELFRQCLKSAIDFHQHRKKAQRKLGLLFGAVAGAAALMGLLALAFFIFREQPAATILENKIRNFKSGYNVTAVERFSNMGETLTRLQEFHEDPAFKQIGSDLRQFVDHELEELTAYQKYATTLGKETSDPANVQTEENLKKLKDKLEELAPPREYATVWKETPALKLRVQRQSDVQAISKELELLKGQLTKLVEAGQEVKILIDEYDKLNDPIKKAMMLPMILPKQNEAKKLSKELRDWEKDKNILIPDSDRITFGNLFRYNTIEQLYNEWKRLEPTVNKKLI